MITGGGTPGSRSPARDGQCQQAHHQQEEERTEDTCPGLAQLPTLVPQCPPSGNGGSNPLPTSTGPERHGHPGKLIWHTEEVFPIVHSPWGSQVTGWVTVCLVFNAYLDLVWRPQLQEGLFPLSSLLVPPSTTSPVCFQATMHPRKHPGPRR